MDLQRAMCEGEIERDIGEWLACTGVAAEEPRSIILSRVLQQLHTFGKDAPLALREPLLWRLSKGVEEDMKEDAT